MTLEEDLVAQVDRVSRKLRTTRSGFARQALRDALIRYTEPPLERKCRARYERKPVERGEFDVWEREQAWGDE